MWQLLTRSTCCTLASSGVRRQETGFFRRGSSWLKMTPKFFFFRFSLLGSFYRHIIQKGRARRRSGTWQLRIPSCLRDLRSARTLLRRWMGERIAEMTLQPPMYLSTSFYMIHKVGERGRDIIFQTNWYLELNVTVPAWRAEIARFSNFTLISWSTWISTSMRTELIQSETIDMNLGQANCFSLRSPTLDSWLEITKK